MAKNNYGSTVRINDSTYEKLRTMKGDKSFSDAIEFLLDANGRYLPDHVINEKFEALKLVSMEMHSYFESLRILTIWVNKRRKNAKVMSELIFALIPAIGSDRHEEMLDMLSAVRRVREMYAKKKKSTDL